MKNIYLIILVGAILSVGLVLGSPLDESNSSPEMVIVPHVPGGITQAVAGTQAMIDQDTWWNNTIGWLNAVN